VLQAISYVKHFGGKHHFCQQPRIDEGKPLMVEKVWDIQNDRFVRGK
jgi:hypothetical protein